MQYTMLQIVSLTMPTYIGDIVVVRTMLKELTGTLFERHQLQSACRSLEPFLKERLPQLMLYSAYCYPNYSDICDVMPLTDAEKEIFSRNFEIYQKVFDSHTIGKQLSSVSMVIDYLNSKCEKNVYEDEPRTAQNESTGSDALLALQNEYGVTHNIYHYPDAKKQVIVLNYDLLSAGELGNRKHPIVMACRSLVISYDELRNRFDIVSQAFERFFDYNSQLPDLAMDKEGNFTKETYLFNKEDGSLICLFFNPVTEVWQFRTRQKLYAEQSKRPIYNVEEGCKEIKLWNEYLFDVVGVSSLEDLTAKMGSLEQRTYIFEWASPLNIHVTPQSINRLVLLGVVENGSIGYGVDSNPILLNSVANELKARGLSNIDVIEHRKVASIQQVMLALDKLENLEEGFVLWQPDGNIRAKIKSNAYLSALKISSENNDSFTLNNLIDVVIYFNESVIGKTFGHIPYLCDTLESLAIKRDTVINNAEDFLAKHKVIENQRDFALAVKSYPLSELIFVARKKKITVLEAWKQATINYKRRVLDSVIN